MYLAGPLLHHVMTASLSIVRQPCLSAESVRDQICPIQTENQLYLSISLHIFASTAPHVHGNQVLIQGLSVKEENYPFCNKLLPVPFTGKMQLHMSINPLT